MGVLRVQVAGAWVDITGGGDEVWVGPDTPPDAACQLWIDTDATSTSGTGSAEEVFIGPDEPAGELELWLDTDAPTPNMPLPAGMPRGFIAKIDSTATGVLAANVTTNMMAGTNVTFESGRRYKITTYWGANRGAAVAQASIAVMGGAQTLMGYWSTCPASWAGHSMSGYFLGDGTTKSVFVTINPGATTMDHSGCYVLIEDIGGF